MKTLSKNQKIAVFVSLGFIVYLLYGDALVNLFNPQKSVNANQRSVPSSGVRVEEITIGSGPSVVAGDRLTVHYVGTLIDSKVFDSSLDRNAPISFTIGRNEVIRGWEEGLIGMRVGGKRRLTIAPDFAYGSERVGPVPPNATLIFEVELLDIKKP